MADRSLDHDAFGEKLAQVLGSNPDYYRLLVHSPTKRMWDLVESLVLEGDPDSPEMALSLFKDLSDGVPEEQADRWLAGLRDAARRIYRAVPSGSDSAMADRLMHMVYSDPNVYELFAAAEPGSGLLEIVESLALEGSEEDIEDMLQLMRALAEEPATPVQ